MDRHLRDEVQVVRAHQLDEGDSTTHTRGFVGGELMARPGVWVGLIRTPPESVSDWNHHGDYDTYIYALAGSARLELGPDGGSWRSAQAGDFVFVPKTVIHRELHPTTEENLALVFRIGSGEPVFNAQSPASAE
jgi:uncharacterized RmlC-like cupin family protein